MPETVIPPALPFVPREFRERAFSDATLRFADSLADNLIAAAELARPRWLEITAYAAAVVERITENISVDDPTLHRPIVWDFTAEWLDRLGWQRLETVDGFQILLPVGFSRELLDSSNLTSVSFYFCHIRTGALAQLGNHDHNLRLPRFSGHAG